MRGTRDQAWPVAASAGAGAAVRRGRECFEARRGLTEYSAAAIDHFTEPRNVGAVGSPDGTGSDANPSCGDRTTITLRVAAGRVAEARFRTFGCTAAIASASALTELATGRTVEEAAALGPAEVLRALAGLPQHKEACALMAVGALRAALLDAGVRRAPREGGLRPSGPV